MVANINRCGEGIIKFPNDDPREFPPTFSLKGAKWLRGGTERRFALEQCWPWPSIGIASRERPPGPKETMMCDEWPLQFPHFFCRKFRNLSRRIHEESLKRPKGVGQREEESQLAAFIRLLLLLGWAKLCPPTLITTGAAVTCCCHSSIYLSLSICLSAANPRWVANTLPAMPSSTLQFRALGNFWRKTLMRCWRWWWWSSVVKLQTCHLVDAKFRVFASIDVLQRKKHHKVSSFAGTLGQVWAPYPSQKVSHVFI